MIERSGQPAGFERQNQQTLDQIAQQPTDYIKLAGLNPLEAAGQIAMGSAHFVMDRVKQGADDFIEGAWRLHQGTMSMLMGEDFETFKARVAPELLKSKTTGKSALDEFRYQMGRKMSGIEPPGAASVLP